MCGGTMRVQPQGKDRRKLDVHLKIYRVASDSQVTNFLQLLHASHFPLLAFSVNTHVSSGANVSVWEMRWDHEGTCPKFYFGNQQKWNKMEVWRLSQKSFYEEAYGTHRLTSAINHQFPWQCNLEDFLIRFIFKCRIKELGVVAHA